MPEPDVVRKREHVVGITEDDHAVVEWRAAKQRFQQAVGRVGGFDHLGAGQEHVVGQTILEVDGLNALQQQVVEQVGEEAAGAEGQNVLTCAAIDATAPKVDRVHDDAVVATARTDVVEVVAADDRVVAFRAVDPELGGGAADGLGIAEAVIGDGARAKVDHEAIAAAEVEPEQPADAGERECIDPVACAQRDEAAGRVDRETVAEAGADDLREFSVHRIGDVEDGVGAVRLEHRAGIGVVIDRGHDACQIAVKDRIGPGDRVGEADRVVARATDDEVALKGGEGIGARVQEVVPGPAFEPVVAIAAQQGVVARAAFQPFIGRGAGQTVVPGGRPHPFDAADRVGECAGVRGSGDCPGLEIGDDVRRPAAVIPHAVKAAAEVDLVAAPGIAIGFVRGRPRHNVVERGAINLPHGKRAAIGLGIAETVIGNGSCTEIDVDAVSRIPEVEPQLARTVQRQAVDAVADPQAHPLLCGDAEIERVGTGGSLNGQTPARPDREHGVRDIDEGIGSVRFDSRSGVLLTVDGDRHRPGKIVVEDGHEAFDHERKDVSIISRTGDDPIVRTAEGTVVARVQDIVPGSADQTVAAIAASKGIVPVPALQPVVPVAAQKSVAACATFQPFGCLGAEHEIVSGSRHQPVDAADRVVERRRLPHACDHTGDKIGNDVGRRTGVIPEAVKAVTEVDMVVAAPVPIGFIRRRSSYKVVEPRTIDFPDGACAAIGLVIAETVIENLSCLKIDVDAVDRIPEVEPQLAGSVQRQAVDAVAHPQAHPLLRSDVEIERVRSRGSG